MTCHGAPCRRRFEEKKDLHRDDVADWEPQDDLMSEIVLLAARG